MPQAAIAPILGGLIAAGGGVASAVISSKNKPSGPPDISKDRKRSLGSFAERLASEEQDFQNARNQDSILLRPGGKPIFNGNPMIRNPNEPLIYK